MKKVSDILKQRTDSIVNTQLEDNYGLFLFNYSGVPSADLTRLRRDLKGVGARLFVTKNSFVNAVLKKSKYGKDVTSLVVGPTALIFVKDDPVAPSKILTDFAKTHESMQLKGGYLQDKLLDKSSFKILSSIPSRQVLYQQVATGFNAPMSKLAMSLNQIIAKIAYALKAVSDKKGK